MENDTYKGQKNVKWTMTNVKDTTKEQIWRTLLQIVLIYALKRHEEDQRCSCQTLVSVSAITRPYTASTTYNRHGTRLPAKLPGILAQQGAQSGLQ